MVEFDFPGPTQWRSWLEWELQGLLDRGWIELSRLVGLLAITGIFISFFTSGGDPAVQEIVKSITVGFCTLLLLHPFLKTGEALATNRIPSAWFLAPLFSYLFVFSGVLRNWLLNLGALVLFSVMLSMAGIRFTFLFSPYYWVLFLILVPGAVGCGLLVHSFQLFVESPGSIRWGISRLFEFFGGVFIRPAWLPVWLYPLHYLIPHSYLSELGRSFSLIPPHSIYYYSVGLVASFLSFGLGTVIFFRVFDDYIQNGRMYRN